MDNLDFTIVASGIFGNLMWEYPDKVKGLLLQVQEECGEEAVQNIMEAQKNSLLGFMHMLICVLFSGEFASLLDMNINRHMVELAKENLKLLSSANQ